MAAHIRDISLDAVATERLAVEQLSTEMDQALSQYGQSGDVRLLPGLIALYQRHVESGPVAARRAYYLRTRDEVEAGIAPLEVLIPFWSEESNCQIVGSATMDYLLMRLVDRPGSLAAVDDLLRAVESSSLRNPGALLGGMLLTGDRRVLEHVRSAVIELPVEHLVELANTQSGALLAGTIDLYVDCLEQLSQCGDRARVRALAAGLVNMLECSAASRVLDVQRNLGQRGEQPAVTIVAQWSFDAYRSQLLPRLELLARSVEDDDDIVDVAIAWAQRTSAH